MTKLKYIFIGLVLAAAPWAAQAQVRRPGATPPANAPARRGTIELTNPLSANTIPEILDRIINFLLVVAAPVAVIMAIWAGFLLLSSGGSEEKVKKGRDTLLWVVIGVAVLILSKGIVSLARSFLG